MQDCLLIINVINRSYFIPNLSLHYRRNNIPVPMTNVVPFKKIVNKKRIKKLNILSFWKIYRKNNNCRVAMTTTYRSTSCNSENLVACS